MDSSSWKPFTSKPFPFSVCKPKVFCTRNIGEGAIDSLREAGIDLCVWEGEDKPSYEIILEKTKDCIGLICLLTDKIDAKFIQNCPLLKIISQLAVGYNNIDITEATKRGVCVTNTPGVLTDTTAETAIALALAAGRRIVEADRYVREGKWKIEWHPRMILGQDIKDSTFGILGMGRIGTKVAKIALGFGAKVIYHDISRSKEFEDRDCVEFVSFEDLLKRSDFFSIHCNLNEGTKYIIGSEELFLMKPNCVLINTARGPVVDENALIEALKEKRIAAAGLDVFETEPIPSDRLEKLKTLDNVVIVPHIGSASLSTRNKMAELVVTNIVDFFSGKSLPNLVNTEAPKMKL